MDSSICIIALTFIIFTIVLSIAFANAKQEEDKKIKEEDKKIKECNTKIRECNTKIRELIWNIISTKEGLEHNINYLRKIYDDIYKNNTYHIQNKPLIQSIEDIINKTFYTIEKERIQENPVYVYDDLKEWFDTFCYIPGSISSKKIIEELYGSLEVLLEEDYASLEALLERLTNSYNELLNLYNESKKVYTKTKQRILFYCNYKINQINKRIN